MAAKQRTGIIVGAVVLILIAAFGFSYRTSEPGADAFVYQGFPFPFHTSGGFAGVNVFDPVMLFLDVLVWAGIALLGAYAFVRFRLRR